MTLLISGSLPADTLAKGFCSEMNSIVLLPTLRGRMDKNRRFGLALLAMLNPSQWFSNIGQESEGD